jgi:O-acetyl-ADP-ribose deacetylase (regulator of RNase III)
LERVVFSKAKKADKEKGASTSQPRAMKRVHRLCRRLNCFKADGSLDKNETVAPIEKATDRANKPIISPPIEVVFKLPNNLSLVVVKGSVTSFDSKDDGAIVNATNGLCLGGGGVDGAVNRLGGPNMRQDRFALPVLEELRPAASPTTGKGTASQKHIRCKTGHAVVTGPKEYGSLKVPYVVHAVGPNYRDYRETEQFDKLLQSAYRNSLECCKTEGIRQVAFSLISSGLYRGNRSLRDVIKLGIVAIRDWSTESEDFGALENIFLYAYRRDEYGALIAMCREEFEEFEAAGDSPVKENTVSKTENDDGSKKQDPLESQGSSSDINGTCTANQPRLSTLKTLHSVEA